MYEELLLLLLPAEESPATNCECEEWMRTACKGKLFYKEPEGKWYCVLHYPGKEKSAAFATTLKKKLDAKDFDFRGVWFPDAVNFRNFEFSTDAIFNSALFSAKVDFSDATFSGKADFGYTTFNAIEDSSVTEDSSATADFSYAKFKGAAYFSVAKFQVVADFTAASFSGAAYFRYATFSARADFRHAVFKDLISFSGKDNFSSEAGFDLQFAQIDKPERIYFHIVTLRPHWFVNVDPRKFDFTNVKWFSTSMEQEIERLESAGVSAPHRLLSIACRHLAVNAEENHRYGEASDFRYMAMDLARQQKWAGRALWKTDWLHVLYWAVSGYGERIWLATLWLLAVWVVFALLYTQVGFTKPEDKSVTPTAIPITKAEPDTIGQPLPLKRAFTYSLGVMSLQKPEPKPLTGTAQTLVLLETILGPLQAALLALAIRRKFMR